jgi:hypothetical protein
MINQEESFPKEEDSFIFFHQIIKKDALEAAAFENLSQADFMSMLLRNLELFENILYQVKAMLREQDLNKFELAKRRALERLEIQQAKMNPRDPVAQQEQNALSNKP